MQWRLADVLKTSHARLFGSPAPGRSRRVGPGADWHQPTADGAPPAESGTGEDG
jgi:hypothetical protein